MRRRKSEKEEMRPEAIRHGAPAINADATVTVTPPLSRRGALAEHSNSYLRYTGIQKSRLAEMPSFTKATTIVNIGHLPGHTNGKETLLRENGFTNVISILCESTPVEEVKRMLAAAATSEGALFLVGGAMMKGFPALMEDLLGFVASECPTILVHKTSTPDFDADVVFPPGPSEAQVNKSALNICLRYLSEGKTW